MPTVAITGVDDALASRVRDHLREGAGDLAVSVVGDVGPEADLERRLADADRVVHLSSLTVHGAHPDNDVPLTEESPLRPVDGYPAAAEHLAAEQRIAAWAAAHEGVPVAVLRPAMVVAADTPPLLVDAFVGGRVLGVRGHRPPFQFLHADDLVSAVAHAATHGLTGAYAVAAEGWLSADEVEAILGRHRLDLPEEVVFSSAERLRMTGLTTLPVGAVQHLVHPWVASVDRLVATGWRPEHSNRDALSHLAATHGDRVVLGPVTTTRREVRQAAGVTAGVAGGLLALGILARRRRRRGEAS